MKKVAYLTKGQQISLLFDDTLVKREGIIRHTILSSLAYAVLRLLMFARGIAMTIGECIAYIQDKAMEGCIREIALIEDKQQRIKQFEDVFIRETAKV